MATQITFDYVLYLNNSLVFRFNNGDAFCMKSFSDGIMVISPLGGCDITAYAKNIAGCFDEGSNLYGLKTIIFSFNGAEVSITKENAIPEKIIELWKSEFMKKIASMKKNQGKADY